MFVVGTTLSPDYPTTVDAYDTTHNDIYDGFVSKLDSNLTTLLASTYIVGSAIDFAYYRRAFIASDSSGNIFIAGETTSTDYPTTPGAYDTSFNGVSYDDGVISKLHPSLSWGNISVNTTNIAYGNAILGTNSDYSVVVGNNGPGDIYISSVSSPSSPFSILNNDCDGSTDENLIQSTTCGVGACSSTGQLECLGGIEVDTCAAYLPVRIDGTTPQYYSTLQSAYNAAGNGAVIQSQFVTFIEDLSVDRPISMSLEGGYTCDYSSITGDSTIEGNLNISDGSSLVGNIIIADTISAPLSLPAGHEALLQTPMPLSNYTLKLEPGKLILQNNSMSHPTSTPQF